MVYPPGVVTFGPAGRDLRPLRAPRARPAPASPEPRGHRDRTSAVIPRRSLRSARHRPASWAGPGRRARAVTSRRPRIGAGGQPLTPRRRGAYPGPGRARRSFMSGQDRYGTPRSRECRRYLAGVPGVGGDGDRSADQVDRRPGAAEVMAGRVADGGAQGDRPGGGCGVAAGGAQTRCFRLTALPCIKRGLESFKVSRLCLRSLIR